MNKERRKRIASVITKLERKDYALETMQEILPELERILMEEEDAFSNMPEGIQMSDRGSDSEEAQENIQSAIDSIEEYVDFFINEENAQEQEDKVEDLFDKVLDSILELESI